MEWGGQKKGGWISLLNLINGEGGRKINGGSEFQNIRLSVMKEKRGKCLIVSPVY